MNHSKLIIWMLPFVVSTWWGLAGCSQSQGVRRGLTLSPRPTETATREPRLHPPSGISEVTAPPGEAATETVAVSSLPAQVILASAAVEDTSSAGVTLIPSSPPGIPASSETLFAEDDTSAVLLESNTTEEGLSVPVLSTPEMPAFTEQLSEPMPPIVTADRVLAGPVSLPEAIELSHRLQPRLRVYLEGMTKAKQKEALAFAPFLPSAGMSYSVGGLGLDAGAGIPIGGSSNFAFLPFTGTVPIGLNVNTGYELADLRVQWLVTDFGKRMSRYRQSQLGNEVARYQVDRAYQTVTNEVTVGYFQVLRAQSQHRIAEEAVRRTEDEHEVIQKLARRGVVEREKVLRAEVAVSQAHNALDTAEAGVGISTAALNLAIGLNVSSPTVVLKNSAVPEFEYTLVDCLGLAVTQRRELGIAQLAVQSAVEGTKIAKASFRPRVVAGGFVSDFQQNSPNANVDLGVGFIKLEWEFFEGGKRIAETRLADSELRTAAAEAEALADAVAFQVTESFRKMSVARRGIDRARPAVEQATEAYRLMRLRLEKGDATPADVTDAETALIRAQQDELNSTYNYLTSFAQLNFAIGIPSVLTTNTVSSVTPNSDSNLSW